MNSLILFFGFTAKNTPKVQEQPIIGTAIVYMSKHGTTNEVALKIKELLKGEDVTLINLDKETTSDLSQCDRIIIGGSIHIGNIQKKIQLFCQKNLAILKSKPLGLFLCCMYDGDRATEQFNSAFPEEIQAAAKSKALMGYELHFDRMNMIDRTITKKITGYSESISQINQYELHRFVSELEH